MAIKSLPFQSPYLPNFEVVEQRNGNISYFPHTEQLPKLWRALNLEFLAGVPGRVARVDLRASGYWKLIRHLAIGMFCDHINGARRDNLVLHAVPDRNLVARISIVQQIAEHGPLGPLYRFKFYAGDDLFKEVFLNGYRVGFAEHALERFSERVPNRRLTDMSNLVRWLFSPPMIVMECNHSPALVVELENSVVAFPIRIRGDEMFLPTCLSTDEIKYIKSIFPPPAYTWHYDQDYTMPDIRNWDSFKEVFKLLAKYQAREPLQLSPRPIAKKMWGRIAHGVKDIWEERGYGEGSNIMFLDNIPGLNVCYCGPGTKELRLKTLAELKKYQPHIDWDKELPAYKLANPEWY